jgi:hypothetical protein
MEKLIYLIWGERGPDPDAVHRKLLEDVAPRLLEQGVRGLTVYVDDSDSAVPTPMPWPADEAPLLAEVALWVDCYDRRGPLEEILSEVGDRRAGYLVSESLYTDYGENRWGAPRDWPDGKRSPGVFMLTLLEQPDSMSYEDWIAHWHGVQSPQSEEMQPRMRYVRNVVVFPVTPDAPPYRGIVEEGWPSAEHIMNPDLFYCAGGSKETLRGNVSRMLENVQGFLEMDRIRSATMSEYLIKT